LFVALVASEEIKFRARLAGAKVDDKPSRRKSSSKDAYGEILERRKRFKEMDEEFAKHPEDFLNKRL
jgi:hypothetical protein